MAVLLWLYGPTIILHTKHQYNLGRGGTYVTESEESPDQSARVYQIQDIGPLVCLALTQLI